MTLPSSEKHLRQARRSIASLECAEQAKARLLARIVVDEHLSAVAEDIPVTHEEQIDLTAFELIAAEEHVTPFLLTRIRKLLVDLAIARSFPEGTVCEKCRRRLGHCRDNAPQNDCPLHPAGRKKPPPPNPVPAAGIAGDLRAFSRQEGGPNRPWKTER